MKLEELRKILLQVTNKVAYTKFNTPQKLPFIVYSSTDTNNMMADGKVYKVIPNVDIGLYTERKDIELEKVLETVLDNNDIAWNKDEDWIEDQQCYVVVYTITLI